jgi:hypothetical protein
MPRRTRDQGHFGYDTYLAFQNGSLLPRIRVTEDIDHIQLGREDAAALLYFIIECRDDNAQREAESMLSRACAARAKGWHGKFNSIKQKFHGHTKRAIGAKSVVDQDQETGALKGRVYKLYWNMTWEELVKYELEVEGRFSGANEERTRVRMFKRVYKRHRDAPNLGEAWIADGRELTDEIDLDAA